MRDSTKGDRYGTAAFICFILAFIFLWMFDWKLACAALFSLLCYAFTQCQIEEIKEGEVEESEQNQ